MTWQGSGEDAPGDVPTPAAAPPPPPPPGPPPAPYGEPASPGIPGAPVAWAPPVNVSGPNGPEVPGAAGLRYAGVLHRLLAYWLDAILVGLGVGIFAGIAGAAAGGGRAEALITVVITIGVEFLYFVGMWTSQGRATIGMRLMKLQIGSAADGRTLSLGQATVRWVALGLPFQALYALPETAPLGALAGLWTLLLLVSTAISPTRQGVHDRLAGSAIVQPIGARTAAFGCLVLLVVLFLLPVLAVIALILLGGDVSTILSAVGESV